MDKKLLPEKIQDAIELCLAPDEEITLADGFEDAFIGIARKFNHPFAVYDRAKCIKTLVKDMTLEDAEEYFQYNVEGAYVGEQTPAFITLCE
jgi:hypothetical protein